MKQLLGWILLLVFVADGFVHPVLFSYEYEEVQRQLTSLESELSAEKADQIGQSQAVIVLDEHNARKRGDIYSANFFTENRDGQTICYSIVDSAQLVDYQKVEKKSTNDPFSKENTNHFFKIQKDLFCDDIIEQSFTVVDGISERFSFLLYIDAKTNPFLAIQTPPPNSIA